MLDIQFVPDEKQLPASGNKIEIPQVFQNQFSGLSFSLAQIIFDKQADLSFARLPNEHYLTYQSPFSSHQSLVLAKQPLFLTKLNPIKAYTSRLNFFQIEDEIMTEAELQQTLATSKSSKANIYFEVTKKFNLKILETVMDLLSIL